MKVAILHDWLVGFRGGERMLEAFCEMYPDADIYTLLHKKGSVPQSIEKHKIYCSFLDAVPGIYDHYRKFLPVFPLAVDSLRLKENYDLVISSTHCVIKGIKIPKDTVHVSYVYTPMRYMYDQFDVYFGPEAPAYQRLGAHAVRSYITNWDKASNKSVDAMIGISQFVRQRIKDIYAIDAHVIYPFVELEDFKTINGKQHKDDFYLMVSAFAPNKRVDLAVEAFNQNGKKLKIVGGGQQDSWLRKMAKPNVEFLGTLDRKAIIDLYSRAKGFVFPGIEDFGITPLESLAAGTPVIAYHGGGVLETMTEDTAVFFKEQTVESLVTAVSEFEKKSFDTRKLQERAGAFSKDRFIKEMTALIATQIANRIRK